MKFGSGVTELYTCSQNRQSIKFQNRENINLVEKLYFFILYNQVYIAKHVLKSLHSGSISSKVRYFLFSYNIAHACIRYN